jgi:hypothetical protein
MRKVTSLLYGLTIGTASGSSVFASVAAADGLAIDKVYHPYVQPLEREIEFRWLRFDASGPGKNDIFRFGYGQSLSDDWFAEIYIIGGDEQDELSVDAYELEAKWQLTEQGEYSADWGMLFELEREADRPNWEFSTSVLVEKEWGHTVGTANLGLAFETGSDINDELESFGAFQLRYRYSRALEPAVELYSGQNTLGAGPVLMGEQRFGVRKKLHWEFGAILGISDETPDTTLRALAEFEF